MTWMTTGTNNYRSRERYFCIYVIGAGLYRERPLREEPLYAPILCILLKFAQPTVFWPFILFIYFDMSSYIHLA